VQLVFSVELMNEREVASPWMVANVIQAEEASREGRECKERQAIQLATAGVRSRIGRQHPHIAKRRRDSVCRRPRKTGLLSNIQHKPDEHASCAVWIKGDLQVGRARR